MSQLVQACRANDVTDLIIAHEHRGEPGIFVDLCLKLFGHTHILIRCDRRLEKLRGNLPVRLLGQPGKLVRPSVKIVWH